MLATREANMVNEKGKGTISSSNLNPKNNDASNTSQSETTLSISMKMSVKETGVANENEDKKHNENEEVMNEENALPDMANGKFSIEEEKNEEIAMEEDENHEDNTMEEDKKNEPNAIDEEDNEQNATEEEGKEQEEEIKGKNEENTIEQAKNEDKLGENSREKVKRSRKRNRKKVAQRGSEIVATKVEDKPESSSKKKVSNRGSETVATKVEDKPGSSNKKTVSKRAESMGMVFMCSSKTKKDCYHYKVLGLPASKRDVVQKVYKGMRLFLFDFDLRLMYGIYKAAGPGGYNIEPKAFQSAFPSQVRFTVLEDCNPLAEEKFKKVIKDNYYARNKFDCQLTSEQVKNLCKLFVASSRGSSNSKKSGRNLKAETRTYADRDRIRRAERRSGLVADRQYHDRPIIYESEMFAPLPRLPPLTPPPVAAPSYVSYGRSLEMDVYGQDPLVEHRDRRLLDLDVRHRDEIGSRDPYISYREPLSYRDPLYSAHLPPPEYSSPGLRAEYRPLTSEYRYHEEAPSEYGPLRTMYRY
ncbi:hypothetical protein CsSME_00016363 [Camellia sinensis var. sinensis]